MDGQSDFISAVGHLRFDARIGLACQMASEFLGGSRDTDLAAYAEPPGDVVTETCPNSLD
jgi:hypothetical protein